MWNRLAKYFVPGTAYDAEGDGENAAVPVDEATAAAAAAIAAVKTAEGVAAAPVEARLRQVEVEDDEWILIDRDVEGSGKLEESWYVTPPACFTEPGPVHVETSPLEDLLIEHPSMSVYRSAGTGSAKVCPAADKKSRHRQAKLQAASKVTIATVNVTAGRLPLSDRNANMMLQHQQQQQEVLSSRGSKLVVVAAGGAGHHHSHHHHHQVRRSHRRHQSQNAGCVAERAPRRDTMRDLRKASADENLEIVQIHSAQKMLEKHSTQSMKRNRLERSNKAREVSSGKGRRPRRQDRLRLNNSGANNNRKC